MHIEAAYNIAMESIITKVLVTSVAVATIIISLTQENYPVAQEHQHEVPASNIVPNLQHPVNEATANSGFMIQNYGDVSTRLELKASPP